MLPPDLVDLNKRLETAIQKHRAAALRAEIIKAAEPQIVLFQTSENLGHVSMGEIHERARKIDPSIPQRFRAAMDSPGLDAMMDLLRAQPSAGERKNGASQVGGAPDLPPDLAWPKHEGRHLPFIAQVELATLPRWNNNPLPRSGWLWAFAGGDLPTCTVLHWDGHATALRRHPTPPADEMLLFDFLGKPEYAPVPLEQAEVTINVPGYGTEWWNAHVDEDDERLGDAMMELVEALEQPPDYPDKRGDAFLLGRLNFSFEESPTDLAVKYGKKKGKDWIPLLQVGSVGNMVWSDEGTLAFLIRMADLAKGDFSDTYATILSS
jgi:uncharacterized protein YwqG